MWRELKILTSFVILGQALSASAQPTAMKRSHRAEQVRAGQGDRAKRHVPDAGAPEPGVRQSDFDPEFAAVLTRALDQSPLVTAAQTDAIAQGVDLRATRWRRLPTVAVSANYYGVKGGEPGRITPTVSVDLVLWNAGRTSGEIERAKGGKRAAEAKLVQTQMDLAIQIAGLFYDAKKLSERVAIVRSNLAELEAMQEGMARRVKQEVSPRSDLELAMTRTMQVRIMLDTLIAQQRVTLERLRQQLQDATWQPLEQNVALGVPLSGGLDDMIGLAEEFDPQKLRLEAEAQIARADAKVTAAAGFPALSAEYSYDDIYRHRFGVVLRGQTNGLSEFGQAHAAKLRETAADQRIAAAERDLREQVTSDFVDYTSAMSRLELVQNASNATGDVRDSYVRQFTSGKRTWLDVMNAMREAMNAQLDAVDVRYTAAQAHARLLIRTGNLPAELERSN